MSAPGFRPGLQLLREPDFARLFSARMISAFGSAMAPIAVAFGVLELTGSASAMGIVIASQTGAQVLVQLLAGALADRGSRQRIIVLADLLAMTTQGTMAFLFVSGSAELWHLVVLMALNGVAFAMMWPASVGLVPQIVDRERLQSANAFLALAQAGAFGMGAATAGVLVAAFGAGWAIGVDSATFAVSALLIALLRPRAQERSAPASLLRDLRDGWAEFISHRWLWTIVLQFSVMLAAWQGSFAVVGPVVAARLLGGPADWGAIAGAYGVGLLAGGLVALRVHVRRPMLVATLCVFLNAGPPLLMSLPAPMPWIAASAFFAGMGGELFGVLWFTTLHKLVAPDVLSRVSAYDILGSIALVPLGEAAAGPLVEAIGIQQTLWIAAAMIIVPTALVLLVAEVRNLEPDADFK